MNFKQKPDIYNANMTNGNELKAKKIILNLDVHALIEKDDGVTYRTWKDVNIQKKTTVYSFRVPKKDMQQLKYISNRTGLSVNAICLMSVQAHNKKILKEFESDV